MMSRLIFGEYWKLLGTTNRTLCQSSHAWQTSLFNCRPTDTQRLSCCVIGLREECVIHKNHVSYM